MNTNINIMDIVPASDIILDDLDNIKGGEGFNVCIKGCITGEKSGKGSDGSSGNNNGSTTSPTDPTVKTPSSTVTAPTSTNPQPTCPTGKGK